jgi:hypothetical protein
MTFDRDLKWLQRAVVWACVLNGLMVIRHAWTGAWVAGAQNLVLAATCFVFRRFIYALQVTRDEIRVIEAMMGRQARERTDALADLADLDLDELDVGEIENWPEWPGWPGTPRP